MKGFEGEKRREKCGNNNIKIMEKILLKSQTNVKISK